MLIYFDITHENFIDEFFTIFITLNILCGKFSQYNQIRRQLTRCNTNCPSSLPLLPWCGPGGVQRPLAMAGRVLTKDFKVLTCGGHCCGDGGGDGGGGVLNGAGLSQWETKMKNWNVKTPNSFFVLLSSAKLSCMIRYRASTATSHRPLKKVSALSAL